MVISLTYCLLQCCFMTSYCQCNAGSCREMVSWYCQVLLVEKKLVDVHAVLGQAGNAIEQWAASSVHQKESLKVFFLVLQVCHYLMCGQVLGLLLFSLYQSLVSCAASLPLPHVWPGTWFIVILAVPESRFMCCKSATTSCVARYLVYCYSRCTRVSFLVLQV